MTKSQDGLEGEELEIFGRREKKGFRMRERTSLADFVK